MPSRTEIFYHIKTQILLNLFLLLDGPNKWFSNTIYGICKTDQVMKFYIGRGNIHETKFTYTLKCLSIGTPKTINFPFVPNGKL